jgi:hypothetical protein
MATTIDVSPLLKWIPEKIQQEIVSVITTLAVVAELLKAYAWDAHVNEAATITLAVITVVLGAIARGTVTPTKNVAVDVREVPEDNEGTSGPVEPGEVPDDLK